MNRDELIEKINKGGTRELIGELEALISEEYDETQMFQLALLYLVDDNVSKGKKVAKKARMLFPSGELCVSFDKMLDSIQNNKTREFCNEYLGINEIEENKKRVAQESREETLLQVLSINKRKKEAREVPESIKEYFTEVVGLSGIQNELGKFYKSLRLQNERKQSGFNGEIIPLSNFIICGQRGSGKKTLAGIISQMLFDFGIRGNAIPIELKARELADAVNGDGPRGLSELFAKYSDCTIMITCCEDLSDENTINAMLAFRTVQELFEIVKKKSDSVSFIMLGTNEGIKGICGDYPILQEIFYGTLKIEPYTTAELLEIGRRIAKKKALLLDETAEAALLGEIKKNYKSELFMNAISVNRYIENAARNMADRYYESDDDSETAKILLKKEDFDTTEEEETIEDLLSELDNLTGLTEAKKQVRKRIDALTIEKQRREMGIESSEYKESLHMVFTGNPGTGKTTVARIIAKIYYHLGILANGDRFIECSRSELVGQYVGHTAKQVQGKVREAMGGVLFIDEAYSLCRNESDSFGHEAVDELIQAMENNRDNLVVILAGYKKEMKEFLKSNPGFGSRIRNYIEFEDYSTDEMSEIFRKMVVKNGLHLENGSDNYVTHMISQRSRDKDFGNARGVRNLFEEVRECMNARLITSQREQGEISREAYNLIRNEDLEKVSGKTLEKEETLQELLDQLDGMIGLEGAKAKVREIIEGIRAKQYMAEIGLTDNSNLGTLHMMFLGNAGTGKTTIARLIGKIYKQLGVLKGNAFIEAGRKDLVAGYTGQTAIKVEKLVEEASGGILFIDEAYNLINNSGGNVDTFGMEAVNTLLAEMENRRDSLMVILAGYAEEMHRFMDANQGLSSRVPNEVVFDDYSSEDMILIFKKMLVDRGLKVGEVSDDDIGHKIRNEKGQTKDFGNARGIRNIVDRVERQKNSRIVRMLNDGLKPDKECVSTIVLEDLEDA